MRLTCIWCGEKAGPTILQRKHGNRCEKNPDRWVRPPAKECEWCKGTFYSTEYKKHGNRCALNPNREQKRMETCTECGYVGPAFVITRFHNEKCNQDSVSKPEAYVIELTTRPEDPVKHVRWILASLDFEPKKVIIRFGTSSVTFDAMDFT